MLILMPAFNLYYFNFQCWVGWHQIANNYKRILSLNALRYDRVGRSDQAQSFPVAGRRKSMTVCWGVLAKFSRSRSGVNSLKNKARGMN
jgi:hypothetical protein